ncbi:MAG: response regulator [Bacteroidota bacterium]
MKETISILVVQDEEIWVRKIKLDLDQFGFLVTCYTHTYEEALMAVMANNYDIAILDINLHGKSYGFELGRMVTQICKKPFIFITGSVEPEIFKEAAAIKPAAYLTKPYSSASLFVSIQSAISNSQAAQTVPQIATQQNDHVFFFVKNGTRYKKIEWAQVTCLRSERNYTSVMINTGESFLIRSSLQKTLRDIIPPKLLKNFIQINRAEVLQIQFIDEIIGDEAKVEQQFYSITDGFGKNLKRQLNIVL